MTNANVFQIENRLAAAMKRPGGKPTAELLRGAERRVAAIRDECLASLGRQIERMRERAAAGREGRDPGALDDLYAAANEIFAIAAAFDLKYVGEAAYEFCDLADHFRERGETVWPAIDVYVDGLKLLFAGPADPLAATSILVGLRMVRARFLNEARAGDEPPLSAEP
jgi:hypothetical protein